MIEQEVEAHEILTRTFDLDALSEKLRGLFTARENQEILRIHAMVDFFEGNACISRRLEVRRWVSDGLKTRR